MTRYKYSNEELANAVAQSISVAGVMRLLGIRPAGGSHFHISKRIKQANLDTSHFTGQSHNRGKMFKQPASYFLRMHDNNEQRVRTNYLRRALLEIGRRYECEMCEIPGQWLGKPLQLHVDHIDGQPSNCTAENLRFLCPNCHAQTPTYCRVRGSRKARDSTSYD